MIQKSSTLQLDSMEHFSGLDQVRRTMSIRSNMTGSGETASPAPSFAAGDETFTDASEDDTEFVDDETIEEESILSVDESMYEQPSQPASGPAPGATPTRASTRAATQQSGPVPSQPAMSHPNPSDASLPSFPNRPITSPNKNSPGFGMRGGASFFKNLRKKKDVTEESMPTSPGVGLDNARKEPETVLAPAITTIPELPPVRSSGRAAHVAQPTQLAGQRELRQRHTSSGGTGASTPSRSSHRTPRHGARTRGARSSSYATGRPTNVRRVVVKGVSPRTLQALVFYLYTSQVHFVTIPHVPRHGQLNEMHEEALAHLGDGSRQNPALWPPAFSNKAAYCLGQQLDLPDLTARAFEHIAMSLSVRSVLADLLSPFGDRFADVQRVHLDFITQHWEEVKTRPDFVPIVENLAHGQYPKSSASLFQLFSKLSVRD